MFPDEGKRHNNNGTYFLDNDCLFRNYLAWPRMQQLLHSTEYFLDFFSLIFQTCFVLVRSFDISLWKNCSKKSHLLKKLAFIEVFSLVSFNQVTLQSLHCILYLHQSIYFVSKKPSKLVKLSCLKIWIFSTQSIQRYLRLFPCCCFHLAQFQRLP